MVGDIPRPLFINKKIKSSWRTESKLALVAIALILRRHIWYVKQVTIEGRCHPVLMENGELIVTIMYCSIP
jgi:hypothetical protein